MDHRFDVGGQVAVIIGGGTGFEYAGCDGLRTEGLAGLPQETIHQAMGGNVPEFADAQP